MYEAVVIILAFTAPLALSLAVGLAESWLKKL